MMTLTIVFKQEFESDMRKQFGSFANPLRIYGVKQVHVRDGLLHSVIWDDRAFRMSDISQVYVEGGDE